MDVRPRIHALLGEFLTAPGNPKAQVAWKPVRKITSLSPQDDLLAGFPIDSSVQPVSAFPGGTAAGSFPFTVPIAWPTGTDTARAVVWDGAPGSSNRLNTYDRTFTVQAQVTNATITVASIPDFVAGSQVTISYTVTNTGNYARSFGVGAEVEHGGTTPARVGQDSTPTLDPGYTASGSFPFAVPADWPSGTDTARAAVWTGAPGFCTGPWLRSMVFQSAPQAGQPFNSVCAE